MNLRYSQQQIDESDIAAVVDVMRSPWLTQGPVIERFEAALCEYTGAKHAVCVSSGTAALHLAYLAAEARSVVTSPLSFMATANAALMAGAEVAFSDVDPASGNIAPLGIETDVIAPVHFAGRACDLSWMQTTSEIVTPSGAVYHLPRLAIVEDSAHALGTICYCGCGRVGNCAHSLCSTFSFHPVKSITTGEGGAVLTNNDGFAQTVRELRSHGRNADGLMTRLGFNYRMPEMSAALGLSQLKRCDEMRERRVSLARIYDLHFNEYHTFAPGYTDADVLAEAPEWSTTSAWHLYPVRMKHGRRDEVKANLNAAGIGGQVHYSPPIHLHPYYRERFGYKPGDFPQAEAWAAEELSLPLHAGMSEADVVRVVDALKEALR